MLFSPVYKWRIWAMEKVSLRPKDWGLQWWWVCVCQSDLLTTSPLPNTYSNTVTEVCCKSCLKIHVSNHSLLGVDWAHVEFSFVLLHALYRVCAPLLVPLAQKYSLALPSWYCGEIHDFENLILIQSFNLLIKQL